MCPRRTIRAPVFTGRSFCERQLGVRFILLAPQLATTLYANLIAQTSANTNTIVQAPLMFVRGGFVNPGNYLSSAGHYGNYWTSNVYDKDSAFFEGIDGYGLLPLDYYAKYYGQSLRCVALGG